MKQDFKKILIIGSGSSNIGNENEYDAACFETIAAIRKTGAKIVYIDNNPFSVSAEEVQAANVYSLEVNFANVVSVIEKEHPDAVMPTIGGLKAIQIAWQLYESEVLEEQQISLLGIGPQELTKIIDNQKLRDSLTEIGEKTIASVIIANEEEAMDFVREVGFPVIVKPISSSHDTSRFICNNPDELDDAIEASLKRTYINRCSIEQSIVGYKEIEMVGVRDSLGNKMLVSGLEDMDPIGIHSGDSIIFAPTQTLLNKEYQALRTSTFSIMDSLGIKGTCHIQFALNSQTSSYFVTKVSPFFTRNTNLAAKSTGYPISYISTFLEMGYSLTEIKLPSKYSKYTAYMEPTSDHVLVKVPIWPFEDIPDIDQHLNTVMKAVGSTIGVGRTVEEAILKALHSSQLSPRDILPSTSKVDEDELINQLIHPLASRILILMEALRRGFSIDELSELTKIDKFYFYKLNQLLRGQKYVADHPRTLKAVDVAHKYGFGDGMLAEMWNLSINDVRAIGSESANQVTFKMVEPSAGELNDSTDTFYSSYEMENESESYSTDDKVALVIGRGGNQLGPNTAADYYTAKILLTLKKTGYRTIIMNTNPNAISLSPQLSDKKYIEPIQLGNILNIIDLEHPNVVFLPGNRHFLSTELKKFTDLNIVLLPPDQKIAKYNDNQATNAIDVFIDGTTVTPITTIEFSNAKDSNNKQLKYLYNLSEPMLHWETDTEILVDTVTQIINTDYWQGLVQIMFNRQVDGYEFVGIRPVTITETAFLTKTTGVDWVATLVKKYLGKLDKTQIQEQLTSFNHKRRSTMTSVFPFSQLQSNQHDGTVDQEAGAYLTFKNFEEQKKA
ncbi:ATP-grasp domain-containing protein [Lentilactobacillus sp. Marseille-Q4993]|uniref:carbamoyl phosphate synthase preATP-grasp domain-containing protein n=1 Tax=Lentilactobacillus sp. Marseille-Q4993 TaxID=3039492 RepID=UPI0024BD1E0E|nr:ATP-grasp domain-containing protein [Lentilactobacillus sp. Marseille-Q4993]